MLLKIRIVCLPFGCRTVWTGCFGLNHRLIIASLLCLSFVGCFFPNVVLGQKTPALLSVEKHDELNVTHLTLRFNRLPKYKVKTSGQRLEVILEETVASSSTILPPSDERLVRVLVGQAQQELMLSFLLRRPPHFVNMVKDVRGRRLVIDLHWRASQRGTRPAISRRLPGKMTVQGGGSVISRGISSKYTGDWLRFFAEYERPIHLNIPLDYTLAPFPCLGLVGDVFDVLPLDVLTLADKGEWAAALKSFNHAGQNPENGDTQSRLLFIKADLYQRAGKAKNSQRYLTRAMDSLGDDQEALLACGALQQLYLAVDQVESPFELLAELTMAADKHYPKALQAYVDLFHAEVAIAAGDIKQAKLILDEYEMLGVAEVEMPYLQRLADVAYLQGDFNGAIGRYQSLGDFLADKPFSLAGYAMSLYRKKQYSAAIDTMKKMLVLLNGAQQRDLTNYMLALGLIHHGNAVAGYDLLHQIVPGTRGAILARGKIADLSIQAEDFYSKRRSVQDFAELIDEMPTRQGRAEMQFKHALALSIVGQRMAAIDALRTFLRDDRLTDLASHAQALLADILPEVLSGLVADGKNFQALVMVEQNRDLLVASQRDFGFLIELGQVFTRLEFSDRAVRLYLYLLDATEDGVRQEQVFVPLLLALTQQEEYPRVLDYVKRYEQRYPAGKHRAEIYFFKLQALLAQGEDEDVFAMLQEVDRPHSVAIDRLAATMAMERNLLQMAETNIAVVVGDDFAGAEVADILFQAEILYRRQKNALALQRYRHLKGIAEFADQACYREATILLNQGERKQGVKLLRQLVEVGSGSQWRTLAQETLQIERFKR